MEERAAKYRMADLKAVSANLTKNYLEKVGGERIVTDDRTALVYSAVRMPATIGAITSALKATVKRIPTIEINSVLDVGAGTGATLWAVADNVAEVDCLEREKSMINLGKQLSDRFFCGKTNWINNDIKTFNPSKKYDLVVASYALNELKDEDRKEVLGKIWNATEKVLLIVEPGTVNAFNLQKSVREIMRSMGAELVSPCPHNGDCPLVDDWCHFTVRIARSKLHKALKGGDVPYEDEKFTYSAFFKGEVERCEKRIIRHPVILPGTINLTVCSNKGIESETVRKNDKEKFKTARKIKCGEEWS